MLSKQVKKESKKKNQIKKLFANSIIFCFFILQMHFYLINQ